MTNNHEKVVLVTGASRGIGWATATLLAEHGYTTFGTARKPSEVSSGSLEVLQLDVTSDQSVQSCVSKVMEQAGRIDVLVNNAAVGLLGAIEETSIEEARALFEANFFGVAKMINAVLPRMRQRKVGLIINFGSLATTFPIPFHAYLTSSKAAIIAYSKALRLELKRFNINVSVVEPGMVATHQGKVFALLRVKRTIGDYSDLEKRAFSVIEEGQRSGGDPKAVAKTVLTIIRSKAPALNYPVGGEKWVVKLSRFLPSSAIESLMMRHFRLPH